MWRKFESFSSLRDVLTGTREKFNLYGKCEKAIQTLDAAANAKKMSRPAVQTISKISPVEQLNKTVTLF